MMLSGQALAMISGQWIVLIWWRAAATGPDC
jgi:hypothetical protein